MSADTQTASEAIGAEVRRVRDELGMTLQEFGLYCGIPWQSIQGYECGRVEPSAGRLLVILHKTRRAPQPFRLATVARAVASAA